MLVLLCPNSTVSDLLAWILTRHLKHQSFIKFMHRSIPIFTEGVIDMLSMLKLNAVGPIRLP